MVQSVGFEPTKAVSKTAPYPVDFTHWRSANSTHDCCSSI